MRPTLVTTADFGAGAHAVRLPSTGWLVRTEEPALLVVDEQLVELKRFPLPSTWQSGHSVSSDLQLAALSQQDHVALIDDRGREIWRRAHPPWGSGGSDRGSCWVSPDGRFVWATVPPGPDVDEWWVLDATTGRVLGVAPLACRAAGSEHIQHPDGVHVGLSVGEGQDSAQVYWGRWDGAPAVTQLESWSRVLVDVRPDGSQYLATPHGADDRVTAHAFPGGAVQASLDEADFFGDPDFFGDDEEDDSLDQFGGYVTNDLVIVTTLEQRHFLLAADTLAVIEEIEYPPGALRDLLLATGRGTWLTGAAGRHQLWRLG